MPGRFLAGLLLVLPLLGACERKPQAPTPPAALSKDLRLTPARFADLPGWSEDRLTEALPALQRSCARLLRSDAATPIGPKAAGGSAAEWREPCLKLASAPADDQALRQVLEAQFTPVQVSAGAEPEGIFTGYYEVELEGAREPSQIWFFAMIGAVLVVGTAIVLVAHAVQPIVVKKTGPQGRVLS